MKDFIYNQNQILPTQWRYGFRSSAATGCGWITTYNALWLMGTCEKPETLIQYYQKAFPLVNGNLGTWVLNLIQFFREQGFRVQVVARRSKFDEAVKDGDACILFYWWRKVWKIGPHYAALAYRNRTITGYNTFRNSGGLDRYGTSLEAFIKKRFFWPMLIVIRGDRQRTGTEY